ncbi:hypothetical protein KWV42_10395 [Clostridioides difficile]|uniref:hypothetical protein n=1 Tax=Clostridioides difficile TaxID=1496 RepID=UPI0010B67C4B|nr:hypothetical protein [Clostridioides difficile]MBY1883495.1 hypothetical protein [Clostridioides difficile]MBZ0781386.1 hypothetical protein [Clostridioides difficile]MBZ0855030.1 hypothetical protein [Clostridioides difficile]MCG7701620.1 hypothetical protein [Clostridioides difficile]
MSQQVKVSISRKDLYSKDYNEVYIEGEVCKSVKNIKSGLVEVMLKIIKELN